MNEPYGSGNNDDIYDDLDTLFNPETACVTDSIQKNPSNVSDFSKTDNITTNVPSQSSSMSNFKLNEDQLKKEEMILYLDLVVTEMDNKKALVNLNAEYIKLKKEADSLRKSLSEKDEKISQLTAENTTLKKNICSLYKTAKSEIDQKDAMLQEANKEIDRLHSRSDRSVIQNVYRNISVETSQCQPSTSRISSVPSQNSKQYEDNFRNKKDQNYQDNKKRNETSGSENSTSTRPSTSSNSSENHLKWNRVNSKHKFSHYESKKHKHLPTHVANNEKCNTYIDKRNNFNKSKHNETSSREKNSPKRQKLCN
ncbi:uncharacterized protein LOC129983782 [Argiope bruennichi]|uniref:Uncharacterized protein n=1 Tax=Argiope bruennichi TaxID=94029 RepID=A0A8T0E3B2_ARGBR|nr:uncharacterized protein LOC129983782 [Argiope bruennichi]KAF8764749.1 hypothetical protein HNY73_022797 [Argiope bruennichi]